jgi:hypothetical protein
LLNADVAHGIERATDVFGKFVPYELEQRAGKVFDQEKLKAALDEFYADLYPMDQIFNSRPPEVVLVSFSS